MAMAEDQFSGVVPPLEINDTIVYVEEEEMGTGVLRIREDDISWSNINGDQKINLKFPNIVIHAVSRDTSVFPFKPCVLLVYSIMDENDIEEEEVTLNYRISTKEPEQLDEIYEMVSDCQQLYPDSELSSDSTEENGEAVVVGAEEENGEAFDGYFTTAVGLQHLSLEGESVLHHLESILVENQNHRSMENGSAQFEDADA